MSRSPPPPLPGGYEVGEKVFYTGTSQTVSTGDKLVHGQQGEVVGPGTGSKRTEGKGVSMRFPGNKVDIGCLLTEVRAASAPPPQPHLRLPAACARDNPWPWCRAVTCEGWVRAGKCG